MPTASTRRATSRSTSRPCPARSSPSRSPGPGPRAGQSSGTRQRAGAAACRTRCSSSRPLRPSLRATGLLCHTSATKSEEGIAKEAIRTDAVREDETLGRRIPALVGRVHPARVGDWLYGGGTRDVRGECAGEAVPALPLMHTSVSYRGWQFAGDAYLSPCWRDQAGCDRWVVRGCTVEVESELVAAVASA